MQRKRKRRGVACLLATVMLLNNFGGNTVFAASTTSQEGDQTVNAEVEQSTEQRIIPFVAEQEQMQVEFRMVNQWEGGYQAEIVLTNNGTTPVSNWQIDFATNDVIENLWNGIFTQVGGVYSVSNTSYNAVIHPGENIVIGYSATGSNYTVTNLEWSMITEAEEKVAIQDSYVYEYETFTVEYEPGNISEEQCSVSVKITNTSASDIENWQLAWKSEDTISDLYNGQATYENGLYTVKNVEYNQDILM